MAITLLPSEALGYSTLRPSHFGALDGTVDVNGQQEIAVDQPGNVVYVTVSAAKLQFDEIVTDQSDATRAKTALIYFSLAKLFGVLADRKAQFVGSVTQPGGMVSTPLGSHAELTRASQRNYQEAKNLYPDAAWPPLDGVATGGNVGFQRTYGS